MDLLMQLNCAINYIEEHIDNDLELLDVSKATAYSPYHFGRLFYYIAEMPLSEYIRKRKLTLAGMELQSSDIKVIDLAMKYGYENSDSFTRAFTKQHGITPTAARQSGVFLKIFPPLTFQIKIKGVQGMNWRIEQKESFEVFGIERIVNKDEEYGVHHFWMDCFQDGSYEKLFDDAGGIRQDPNDDTSPEKHVDRSECTIRAITGYGDPNKKTFPAIICAIKKKEGQVTARYSDIKIPAMTWAIFSTGDIEMSELGIAIPKLFSQAYSEWLPTSGYDKANGPDMEIRGYAGDGKYYDEVWVSVVKK